MTLTPYLKSQIDAMSYKDMLRRWRFAPAGDEMFQGESGEYFAQRMNDLQRADPDAAVRVSKEIGW